MRFSFGIVMFVVLFGSLLSAKENLATADNNPSAAIQPVNHARVTFESSPSGEYQYITLNWNFQFQDTNYTVTCSPQAVRTELMFFQIYAVTPSTVTVEIETYPTAEQITIHCLGVHD